MSKREDNRDQQVLSLRMREKFLDSDNFKENLKVYSQDVDLLLALSSQGNWAKYQRDDFLSMSLNTYKTVADKHLYDGFLGIDKKRKIAFELLNAFLRSDKNQSREKRSDTKKQLQSINKDLEYQLSMMRESNLILTKSLEITLDALEKINSISEKQETIDIVNHEMDKIKSLLKRSYHLSSSMKS